MFRKLNYNKIARSLIDIEPMPMPTGRVFYLDYKYDIMAPAREQLKQLTKDKFPREEFIQLLKLHKAEDIRQLVKEDCPQWLEDIDKLLVLK